MPSKAFPENDRVVRERERLAITGVSTSTWYPLMSRGLAPRPIQLSPHSVGWLESELVAWIAARKAERDARVADRKVAAA